MNSFEDEIKAVSRDLDRIEMELMMCQEALESIEMEVRFLETELDYLNEGW